MDKPDNGIIKALGERFAENGSVFDGFDEQDILAVLFGSIIGGERAAELARSCTALFGSVEGTLGALPEELLRAGFTELEAENLIFLSRTLKRAALERYPLPINISDGKKVEGLLRALFTCERREVLYLFPVKGKLLTACHRMAEGSEIMVQFNYERAVSLLEGSTGYILAHNHPNSSCQPSRADVSAAKYTAGKLKLLGFEHICHYTVGKDGVGIVLDKPNYIEILMDGGVI